jgi:hypothetical protein
VYCLHHQGDESNRDCFKDRQQNNTLHRVIAYVDELDWLKRKILILLYFTKYVETNRRIFNIRFVDRN